MTGEADIRLATVVLAAGAGRRFGGGKLLAPWRGAPLLHAALDVAAGLPCAGVTVVVGADAAAVADCARAFDPAIAILHAPDHAEGMAASLRRALESLPADVDAALVMLADMPRVPRETLPALVAAVAAGAAAAAPVFGGRRGNPVVLARRLFAPVAALRGDVGARAVLSGLGRDLALVEARDDGVLFDVDTPADLARGAAPPA